MSNGTMNDAFDKITREDPRYPVDAYYFVCEALQHTSTILDKPKAGPERHVSGSELLEGIRSFAIQQFGPMTITVLKTWGISDTSHFGDVVFNMVDREILGKTGRDKLEDFAGGYEFCDAFARPFLPAAKR